MAFDPPEHVPPEFIRRMRGALADRGLLTARQANFSKWQAFKHVTTHLVRFWFRKFFPKKNVETFPGVSNISTTEIRETGTNA
jgi:hypothetical protein